MVFRARRRPDREPFKKTMALPIESDMKIEERRRTALGWRPQLARCSRPSTFATNRPDYVKWFFDLFLSRGPEYDRLRERALPPLMTEPDRVPDHVWSGPEMPFGEEVRKRLFGES